MSVFILDRYKNEKSGCFTLFNQTLVSKLGSRPTKKCDLNGSFAVENKSLSTKASSIKGRGCRNGIFGLICVITKLLACLWPKCVLKYKEWWNKDGMKFSWNFFFRHWKRKLNQDSFHWLEIINTKLLHSLIIWS